MTYEREGGSPHSFNCTDNFGVTVCFPSSKYKSSWIEALDLYIYYAHYITMYM